MIICSLSRVYTLTQIFHQYITECPENFATIELGCIQQLNYEVPRPKAHEACRNFTNNRGSIYFPLTAEEVPKVIEQLWGARSQLNNFGEINIVISLN